MKALHFLGLNSLNIVLILIVLILSCILSCDTVFPYLSQIIPSCDKLIPFVLPIYVCLFPIIVAVVTVVYQIHCTRYTLEDFQNDIKARFWGLFSLSILGFIATLLFWFTDSSVKFLYFSSLIILVVLFCETISFVVNFNSISIEGYVENFKNDCIKNLEKEKKLADYLEKCSKIIEHYFKESVERKESNYINCIIKAKIEIFKAYACKINFLLMNESLNETENERILKIFAESLTNSFIYLSENNSSKSIKRAYAECFIDVCYSCIECQNKILFEALIKKISNNATDLEKDDFEEVLRMLCSIQKKSLKKKKDEYAEIVDQNILNIIVSSRFGNCKTNTINILISCGVIHNRIFHSTEDSFKKIFSSVVDALIDSSDDFDVNDALFFSFLVTNTLEGLEQMNCFESFVSFLDGIKKILRRAIVRKNEVVVQIVGRCYTKALQSKLNKDDYVMDTEMLFYCLRNYPSEAYTFVPNYSDWLDEHPSTEDFLNILKLFSEIVDEIDKNENSTIFTYFLNHVNESLSFYYKKEKVNDEKIIAVVDWYKYVVLECIQNRECRAYDNAITMFYGLYAKVVKQKSISDLVAEKILIFFDNVGDSLMETNDYDAQRKVVEIIYEILPNELSYCRKNAAGIMRISDIIFHFIVDSLQCGNTETLKICSNALGWYALSLSKMGVLDCFKKTVDYAFLMIELAVCQKCDERTTLFLGTLVVVLGAYSNIHNLSDYETYLVKKVNESNEVVRTKVVESKKFRYYVAAYWNDLLGGDARKGMDDFMSNFAKP